jgi:hypothetical protein
MTTLTNKKNFVLYRMILLNFYNAISIDDYFVFTNQLIDQFYFQNLILTTQKKNNNPISRSNLSHLNKNKSVFC